VISRYGSITVQVFGCASKAASDAAVTVRVWTFSARTLDGFLVRFCVRFLSRFRIQFCPRFGPEFCAPVLERNASRPPSLSSSLCEIERAAPWARQPQFYRCALVRASVGIVTGYAGRDAPLTGAGLSMRRDGLRGGSASLRRRVRGHRARGPLASRQDAVTGTGGGCADSGAALRRRTTDHTRRMRSRCVARFRR
jgi:hypothetical protein